MLKNFVLGLLGSPGQAASLVGLSSHTPKGYGLVPFSIRAHACCGLDPHRVPPSPSPSPPEITKHILGRGFYKSAVEGLQRYRRA